MPITLKQRMTHGYVRLELEMSVGSARAALAQDPGRPGAVFDRDLPVTLLAPADLEAPVGADDRSLFDIVAQLPPGIVASSDMTVDAFVESGAFTALMLGARGVFVMEGAEVVGMLTEEAIDDDLSRLSLPFKIRGMPDSTLGGMILTGSVVMYCDQFGHRNELAYYNRHEPPACQVDRPHTHPIRRRS